MGHPYEIANVRTGMDVSFMEHGTCRVEGHRRELFFMEYGRSAAERAATMEAKSICLRCPVQADCFQYALDANEHGVWGATTRDERLYFALHGRLPQPKPLRRRRG